MDGTDNQGTNLGAQEANSLTFEDAIGRIDAIVKKLERGDAPLNESLAMFEDGTKLINVCSKMLDDAEQIVVRLQKGASGELEETRFDDDD